MKHVSYLLACLLTTSALSLFSHAVHANDTSPAKSPDNTALNELIYKSALFPFLQGDYFAGMTALHVAKEKQRIDQDHVQAELLLGSLYLSYGMHNEAEGIFLRLADHVTSGDTLNRIWIQLGEIYYKTENFQQAEHVLSRITDELPPSLRQRANFLLGNSLLSQGKVKPAIDLLTTTNKDNIWNYYGLYNVGIQLLNSDQPQTGRNALNHLISLPASNMDEAKSLQDKARITLGYHKLAENDFRSAIKYFSDISLNSPYTHWGLYGLGRSAYANHDYQNALQYWLALRNTSNQELPNIEAQLATSQLYFRLGALQQSLDGFNHTLELCDNETATIDVLLNQLNHPDSSTQFIDNLLSALDLPQSGDLAIFNNRPYFAKFITSDEFLYFKNNYRHLKFFNAHLRTWQDSITSFEELLSARKSGYDEKLPIILNRQKNLQLSHLSSVHKELTETITEIEETQNSLLLANDAEIELLKKLDNVATKLARFNGHIDNSKQQAFQNKYDLLKGVMQWNLDTDYKPRLRKLQKTAQEVTKLLTETTRLDNALVSAQVNAPNEFASYNAQIQQYRSDIDTQLKEIEMLHAVILGKVRDQLSMILDERKQKIAKLHSHAQFAVAQIYDLSLTSQKRKQ